jgi:hypothetical protein
MLKIATSNISCREKTIDFALTAPFSEIADRGKTVDGGPSSENARTWKMILPRLIEHLQMGPFPAD